MRARMPDVEGCVERDGVTVGYEVFGSGEPTVLLAPFWQNVPSRAWKGQVHDLAKRASAWSPDLEQLSIPVDEDF